MSGGGPTAFEGRRRELHDAFVESYGRYLVEDGSVSSPREYVVIIGHRR